MKVSDSLDNVPNENVVTHLVTDRQSDQLLELLEWLFATKNKHFNFWRENGEDLPPSVSGASLAIPTLRDS